jgi:hypothetical protein
MVKKIQKDRLKEKFIKISTKEGKLFSLFICLNHVQKSQGYNSKNKLI